MMGLKFTRAHYERVALSLFLICVGLLIQVPAHAQEDVGAQVLDRINRARAEANLPLLARNAQLDAAAQGHASDLLQNGVRLGHRGSDGTNIRQRIARAGYNGAAVGENWAGYRSLELIFEFWLNDPPHRNNILNARYAEIGIGVAARANGGYIIVTDFGAQTIAESSSVQPTAMPKKPRAKKVSPTLTPVPTRRPPRKPTVLPTEIPTTIPTQSPAPTQIAILMPAQQHPAKPMRARAKIQQLTLGGQAKAALGASPANSAPLSMTLGGALVFGGALLLGISIIGHRRRRYKLSTYGFR